MQFHIATMIGRAALRLVDRLGSIGLLLYQVASCMWSGQFRMRVLVEQIAKIGVQSQPVVIITGAFTGAVLEAQTLFQLQTVRMETMGGAVVAVGNAPTALFRLLEIVAETGARPAAVIGIPVGFVGAAESKEALVANPFGLDYLVVRGRRGGSAMTVAAVNAIASTDELTNTSRQD